MADADPRNDTYDPGDLEATRERDQGAGVGQKDIDRQRDAARVVEQPSFQSTVEVDADPDEPAMGPMHHGVNHTRWEGRADVKGQGPKTLAAQRAQQKRAT